MIPIWLFADSLLTSGLVDEFSNFAGFQDHLGSWVNLEMPCPGPH